MKTPKIRKTHTDGSWRNNRVIAKQKTAVRDVKDQLKELNTK